MIATTHRQDIRRHRWWSRRPAPGPFHHDRPADVLAVLEHARAIVEAGWVQNRWTVTRPAVDADRPAADPAAPSASRTGRVTVHRFCTHPASTIARACSRTASTSAGRS